MATAGNVQRAAVIAGVLAVGTFACQLIAGIDYVEHPDRPDTGFDAGFDNFIPDPCIHAEPPDPPATDPAPGLELPQFALSMTSILADPTSDGGPTSFDLDGVCTCDSRPGSAEGGVSSCVEPPSATPRCDGDGGTDNRAAEAVIGFTIFGGLDQLTNFGDRIRAGKQTLLVFLRKYNGLEDDREVEVGLSISNGIFAPRRCDASVSCDEGSLEAGIATCWSPCDDGDDPWTTPSGYVDQGGFPTVFGTGYVTKGRLVVRLDRPLRIPFGDVGLSLGNAITTGTLVPLDENMQPRAWDSGTPTTTRGKRMFRLEHGTIAGRAPAIEALSAFGSFVTPKVVPGSDGGSHVCSNPFAYPAVKNAICGALDIAASKNLDFVPGFKCNAISVAVGITGAPSVWGGNHDEPDNYNECYPTGDPPRPQGPGATITTYSCE